jgi:outer membrane immunogenic protein
MTQKRQHVAKSVHCSVEVTAFWGVLAYFASIKCDFKEGTMKKLLIAGAALAALIGTPALAADMPLKAPLPPAPAWSWTGFYLGGNIGYSVGRDPTNQFINAPGAGLGGSVLITADDLSPIGFLGGGQIGYNLQMAPSWLIGIEADFQGADQRGSSCSLECGLESLTVQQKLDWFGTVRARIGYINGDYLWYVTGGGAYAKVDSNEAFSVAAGVGAGLGSLGGLNTSTDRGGWVIGGGVETHLSANWTAKLEALYMDLGQITNTYAIATGIFGAGAGSVTVSSNIRDYIFRTGLNYKF